MSSRCAARRIRSDEELLGVQVKKTVITGQRRRVLARVCSYKTITKTSSSSQFQDGTFLAFSRLPALAGKRFLLSFSFVLFLPYEAQVSES